MYRKAGLGVIGIGTNLTGKLGEKTTIGMYHLASKICKFNSFHALPWNWGRVQITHRAQRCVPS